MRGILEQDRQCTCNVTMIRFLATIRGGKPISIIYSECVCVPLGIQHAKSMRRITWPPMAGRTVRYFSTLSHKRYDFRGGGKKELLNKKRVF